MLAAIQNILALVLYCVAACSLGVLVLQWSLRRSEHTKELSGISAVNLGFLLGIGILSNVWLVIALVGVLSDWVIYPILILLVFAARYEIAKNLCTSWKSMNLIGREFFSEPILWKVLTLASVANLLLIPYFGLSNETSGDAAHYNLPMIKVAGFLGQLKALPVLDVYVDNVGFGTVGEMNLLPLLIMKGMVPAYLLTGIVFVSGILLLLSLGRLLETGIRGSAIGLTMVTTTLPIYGLVGSGSVHVFGLALAIGAAFSLVVTRDLRISGLLTGFSMVASLSNVIVFGPIILSILFLLNRDHIRSLNFPLRKWTIFFGLFYFGIWCAVPFLTHLLKNVIVAGNLLAASHTLDYAIWGKYSTTTFDVILRYILLLPLAAVFGNFNAQGGTLSYLVLMFLPFGLLIKSARDSGNQNFSVGKLTLSAVVGLVVWTAIFPSVFVTRYILACYFLFIPLAARGAEVFSKNIGRIFSSALALLILFHFSIPLRNIWIADPALDRSLAALTETDDVCAKDRRRRQHCREAQALNAAVQPGDRVLFRVFYNYWLRPEVLICGSSYYEWNLLFGSKTPDAFWTNLRRHGFSVLYIDSSHGTTNVYWNPPVDLDHPPADVKVTAVFKSDRAKVYRFDYPEIKRCQV